MKITVNGKTKIIDAPQTVAGLLVSLGLDPHTAVVERNRKIVSRDAFERVHLEDGDTVEIVRLVAGG